MNQPAFIPHPLSFILESKRNPAGQRDSSGCRARTGVRPGALDFGCNETRSSLGGRPTRGRRLSPEEPRVLPQGGPIGNVQGIVGKNGPDLLNPGGKRRRGNGIGPAGPVSRPSTSGLPQTKPDKSG